MRKIVDSFIFFNELDLLEIRLEYLYDSVDYFVIVESNTTFTGNPKPYNFLKNKQRFKKFDKKIIYSKLDLFNYKPENNSAWEREIFQRNHISQALSELNLDQDDLIFVSDVDEIPNKASLLQLKNNNNVDFKTTSNFKMTLKFIIYCVKYGIKYINKKKKLKYKLRLDILYYILFKKYSMPISFKMIYCYYFLNYRRNELGNGTVCLKLEWLNKFSIDEIRNYGKFSVKSIESGWHFSYLGGKELIKYKLENFSHQEYNIKEIVSDEYIDFCINNGYNLFEYYLNPNNPKKNFYKINIDEYPNDLKLSISNHDKLILK